ncbi:hypothetical protein CesoFtcFv8_006541 [Champsocephalus esox]|uniref:Uncharacterized protein n=2 Tax=Champsocephalus TaxID=52236 RepID=A0AAN8HVI9_CHAGU|nr:hypothetical protein CesoFtcFv8_006541 [Champsocephalus esox]KAK5929678.1 hypothetical protein CgunFtcFv8_010896 [Champsocephalus gunnari]
MLFDRGSEEPDLGPVNRGYLFLGAGGLLACVKLSSVVMLSTVDGAPGEPSQGRNTRPPGTICQSGGTDLRA